MKFTVFEYQVLSKGFRILASELNQLNAHFLLMIIFFCLEF